MIFGFLFTQKQVYRA